MSLQGSFFMCVREKYWELELCDESWGSWGQQGTEVAIKTWLSGGRVLCNFDTWYAHLFRTQHGFSFPYPQSGKSQDKARRISRDIFLNNKWEKQKYPLSWLLERFWDSLQKVGDNEAKWEEEDLRKLKELDTFVRPEKGIIFYTDNQLRLKIARPVQKQLDKISQEKNIPIVSCSLKPMSNMGHNVHLKLKRSYLTMFKQILTALEVSKAEYIYFCEHDVLYHPSHFDFIPPDKSKFYYNRNWWKVREDGLAVHWDADQVSGLVCSRELAIEWYKERVATFDPDDFDRKFEPPGDDTQEGWRSEFPCIDIRHNKNLTFNKWKLEHFRKRETAVNFKRSTIDKIDGWEDLGSII